MPDAQPKPTAAEAEWGESLAEQVATEVLYAAEPDTHPQSLAAFAAARQRVRIVLTALSEAGLLATAEHDAQVLRDAAADAPGTLGITSGSRIEVGDRAAAWLRVRADRIEAGDPT